MGAVTECQGRWLLKASVSPEGTLAKRGGHWAFLWGMHAALAWAALRSGSPRHQGFLRMAPPISRFLQALLVLHA